MPTTQLYSFIAESFRRVKEIIRTGLQIPTNIFQGKIAGHVFNRIQVHPDEPGHIDVHALGKFG